MKRQQFTKTNHSKEKPRFSEVTKSAVRVMICPPNRGSPNRLVEKAAAKTHRLALAALVHRYHQKFILDSNILDFAKSKCQLFATIVFGYGDLTMEGLCHEEKYYYTN